MASSFLSRYPNFTPNPRATVTEEFERLARQMGWSQHSRSGRYYKEWVNFMTDEFDRYFAADTKSESYQLLYRVLDLEEPVPTSITQCRRAFKRVHVNLIDVIDAVRLDTEVRKFASARALKKYLKETKVVFPKAAAKKGVLKELLREIR